MIFLDCLNSLSGWSATRKEVGLDFLRLRSRKISNDKRACHLRLNRLGRIVAMLRDWHSEALKSMTPELLPLCARYLAAR
jgi:hypothetical protein